MDLKNQIIIIIPEWFYYLIAVILIIYITIAVLEIYRKILIAKTEDMKAKWQIQKEQ